MKYCAVLVFAAALVLAAPASRAQSAGDDHPMFDRMDKKIDEALKSRGAERRAHMMEHMTMMRDQMQAMRGMMQGNAEQGAAGQKMGSGHIGSGKMGPGNMGERRMGPEMMGRMQTRMDMMQRMMEQMQKQHELMLQNDG